MFASTIWGDKAFKFGRNEAPPRGQGVQQKHIFHCLFCMYWPQGGTLFLQGFRVLSPQIAEAIVAGLRWNIVFVHALAP